MALLVGWLVGKLVGWWFVICLLKTCLLMQYLRPNTVTSLISFLQCYYNRD